jgi:nucleoside-diphosphate-sugar epimerase
VTGATGKIGRVVIQDLLENDVEVVATDISTPRTAGIDAVQADLTDYGQVLEVLKGVDAVIHRANIPTQGMFTPAATFNTNMSINFNVLHAAADREEFFLGVQETREIGEFETLLATSRACVVSGYEPCHTWRNYISSTNHSLAQSSSRHR